MDEEDIIVFDKESDSRFRWKIEMMNLLLLEKVVLHLLSSSWP